MKWQQQIDTLGKYMKTVGERSYFFDQGIRFECQRCGACCTGSPGTVYVGKNEIIRISHFLGISDSQLIDTYLYPYRKSYSIREARDGECFFFDAGCKIYPVRPDQCRTFPFWFSNLRSREKWQHIRGECPGIGCGPLFTKHQILEIVQLTFDF
jgi:Fe-S-cluster containining protein